MNATALVSILGTGFVVAFFHAAIPTHWLPFVIAARARHWSRGRTLGVAALAGGGHVLLTTLLGILVVGLGIAVDRWTGDVFPKIASGLLLAFGGYYLVQHFRGHSHSHLFGGHDHGHAHRGGDAALGAHDHGAHDHGAHDHASHDHASHDHASHNHASHDHASHNHASHDHASHDHGAHDHGAHDHGAHSHHAHVSHDHHHAAPSHASSHAIKKYDEPEYVVPTEPSDRAVILSLLALLTFSPCEGFLPVYLSGIAYGWVGFALLSAVLAGATLTGMMIFTWLTLAGLERFRLGWLEKNEGILLGSLLCVLAVVVYWLEAR